MMTPPKQALAAAARRAIELRTEWDSPHSFEILCWDEDRGKLVTPVYTCIMTDIDPETQYTPVMIAQAGAYSREHPDRPAYAYLLTHEEHVVELPPGASRAALARAAEASRTHTVDRLPEARERAVAWCVDIHGRGWSAARYRDRPEVIEERFWRPGSWPNVVELRGLIAVAYTTGQLQWGLPGLQQPFN